MTIYDGGDASSVFDTVLDGGSAVTLPRGVVATNLATNPKVGIDLTNWRINGSAGSGATFARGTNTARAYPFTNYARLVLGSSAGAAAAGPGITYADGADFTPGLPYTFSVYGQVGKVGGVSGATNLMSARLIWLNSSGVEIGTRSYAATRATGSTWNERFVVTAVAPAGAASYLFTFYGGTGATNWSSGDVIYATAVMVTAGTTAVPFFDGDAPWSAVDSYGWTGAANASSSVHALVAAPTVTVLDDDTRGPRAAVAFTDLAAGVQTINVYRTAEGRTMPVRGGVDLYAVGGASVLDQEIPFGVAATYQAEQFDADGASLGMTPAASVTVDTTDTWVSQPLNPALALQVRIRVATTQTLAWESPGDTVWTQGASVGRTINGQRSGLKGATVMLRLIRPSDAATFDSMFGSYDTTYPAVLCIRTPRNVPIPAVLFWGCTNPKRVTSGANKLVQYQLDGSEVAPPAPGLVVPTLSRDDIDAAYPTRDARAAAYATRLERDSDYTLAGLAT